MKNLLLIFLCSCGLFSSPAVDPSMFAAEEAACVEREPTDACRADVNACKARIDACRAAVRAKYGAP